MKKTNKEKWDPFIRGFILFLWVIAFWTILGSISSIIWILPLDNKTLNVIIIGATNIIIIFGLIFTLMAIVKTDGEEEGVL